MFLFVVDGRCPPSAVRHLIHYCLTVRALPPYALDAPEFRFRALAALAGRASLGGARELVLATLLGARLVDGMIGTHPLSTPLRRLRTAGARSWLSALTLPAAARATMARLLEVTASDDRRALADAWEAVVSIAAPALDVPSRVELRRLTADVSAAA